MATPMIRPLPDKLTGEFWAAASKHRLVLQRCDACGKINQPPQPMCGYCSSTSLTFKDAGTTGVVYSWTTALRRPGAARTSAEPGGEPDTVLVVAVGADPDALLCGHVEGRPSWVEIGAPVTVTFRDLSYTEADGEERTVTLPDFIPAATKEA
jgi:hypothetical protein